MHYQLFIDTCRQNVLLYIVHIKCIYEVYAHRHTHFIKNAVLYIEPSAKSVKIFDNKIPLVR